jgi:hypothetical protein
MNGAAAVPARERRHAGILRPVRAKIPTRHAALTTRRFQKREINDGGWSDCYAGLLSREPVRSSSHDINKGAGWRPSAGLRTTSHEPKTL